MSAFEWSWGNSPLTFLPQRALWRAEGRELFVADLHLGKADLASEGGQDGEHDRLPHADGDEAGEQDRVGAAQIDLGAGCGSGFGHGWRAQRTSVSASLPRSTRRTSPLPTSKVVTEQ